MDSRFWSEILHEVLSEIFVVRKMIFFIPLIPVDNSFLEVLWILNNLFFVFVKKLKDKIIYVKYV